MLFKAKNENQSYIFNIYVYSGDVFFHDFRFQFGGSNKIRVHLIIIYQILKLLVYVFSSLFYNEILNITIKWVTAPSCFFLRWCYGMFYLLKKELLHIFIQVLFLYIEYHLLLSHLTIKCAMITVLPIFCAFFCRMCTNRV